MTEKSELYKQQESQGGIITTMVVPQYSDKQVVEEIYNYIKQEMKIGCARIVDEDGTVKTYKLSKWQNMRDDFFVKINPDKPFATISGKAGHVRKLEDLLQIKNDHRS